MRKRITRLAALKSAKPARHGRNAMAQVFCRVTRLTLADLARPRPERSGRDAKSGWRGLKFAARFLTLDAFEAEQSRVEVFYESSCL
jgi:hypothetical protein